jgi:hypothetical protein
MTHRAGPLVRLDFTPEPEQTSRGWQLFGLMPNSTQGFVNRPVNFLFRHGFDPPRQQVEIVPIEPKSPFAILATRRLP